MFHEIIWNKEEYQKYQQYLISLQNEKNQKFNEKLTTTKYKILGIPIPKQREIAKNIQKGDNINFLKFCQNEYFEEIMIEGFLIASITEESIFDALLEPFIKKIDNWAICDSFCNTIKIVQKNQKKYFPFFLKFLKSEEEFKIRVGLITILSHFIHIDYLPMIFDEVENIKTDTYYVNMAVAWLLTELFIKYPEFTKKQFEKTSINDFTMNKTISKIRDSFRVSKETKEEMLKFKRRKTNEKNNYNLTGN